MKTLIYSLYWMFNITVGTLIGFITWIPRLIGTKLGYKYNIYVWLDEHFPLPGETIVPVKAKFEIKDALY